VNCKQLKHQQQCSECTLCLRKNVTTSLIIIWTCMEHMIFWSTWSTAPGTAAFSEHTEQLFWSTWSSCISRAHGAKQSTQNSCFFTCRCFCDSSLCCCLFARFLGSGMRVYRFLSVTVQLIWYDMMGYNKKKIVHYGTGLLDVGAILWLTMMTTGGPGMSFVANKPAIVYKITFLWKLVHISQKLL